VTEAEWFAAASPMLEFLKGKASDRKLRLFAAACCRVVWSSLTHERSRQAVGVAEQFADGLVDDSVLTRAHSMALDALARYQEVLLRGRKLINRDGETLIERRLRLAAQSAHVHKPFLIGRVRWIERDPDLSLSSPILLREIVGNPFRPVSVNQSWLTSTVLALATGIYADRAFDRMPILADALQDAGCVNEDVLTHCRGPGPHVRGCWVIDLLLGKE
jgi:hypothetical protein